MEAIMPLSALILGTSRETAQEDLLFRHRHEHAGSMSRVLRQHVRTFERGGRHGASRSRGFRAAIVESSPLAGARSVLTGAVCC
jgi:hypothetical protein